VTAPGATGPRNKGAVARSPWLAGLLSLFTPGVGHLYVGNVRRALAAAGVVLGAQAILLAAAVIPPETPAIGYTQLGLLALYLLLLVAVLVDAVKAARRAGLVTLGRFSRPLVYLLAIVAWIAEYQIYDRMESALSASITYPAMAGAMEPTLLHDDLVFAHRGYYADNAPAYGDVVALRNPADRYEVWLLRVVALPGDRVALADGKLMLNGQPAPRHDVDDAGLQGGGRSAYSTLSETLPGGVSYQISEQAAAGGFADNRPEQQVPEDTVFLLGDNRDKATDSRIFGPVPVANLEGRLTFIFWSREESRAGMDIQPGG
jgi:signal peptidase I